METFVGNFLIRRAKTTSGEPVFIIAGAAIPENFPLSSINDNDEVWSARLTVTDIIKHEQKNAGSTGYHGGIEQWIAAPDALRGDYSPWKKKI